MLAINLFSFHPAETICRSLALRSERLIWWALFVRKLVIFQQRRLPTTAEVCLVLCNRRFGNCVHQTIVKCQPIVSRYYVCEPLCTWRGSTVFGCPMLSSFLCDVAQTLKSPLLLVSPAIVCFGLISDMLCGLSIMLVQRQ